MTPDFGDVERIFFSDSRLLFCHDLEVHLPSRELFSFDRFKEISLITFPVFAYEDFRYLVGDIFDPLLGLEMILDPYPLPFGIDQTLDMASKP